MTASVQYVFSGIGLIDPIWVRVCLNLFREQQVNIRRLLLQQDPSHNGASLNAFSRLEFQFGLPLFSSDSGSNAFLPRLERIIAQQAWTRQTLTPLISTNTLGDSKSQITSVI